MIAVTCLNRPIVRTRNDLPRIEGRVQLELMAPVTYRIAGHVFHDVIVPAGYIFDGASIPRALWWFAPPVSDWLEAAVLHDWLYWTRCMTRLAADECLRQLVRQCGHGAPYAAAVYRAVRMFGGGAYRSGEAILARLEHERLCGATIPVWRRAAWQAEDWSVLEDFIGAST